MATASAIPIVACAMLNAPFIKRSALTRRIVNALVAATATTVSQLGTRSTAARYGIDASVPDVRIAIVPTCWSVTPGAAWYNAAMQMPARAHSVET